jgi:hypothetical protein
MPLELTSKQTQATKYLADLTTTELLFGGGAGGAKSFLGCLRLIDRCTRLPETRWLMGRAKLKTLKITTFRSFKDASKMLGVDHLWQYNGQDNIITFWNGSEIIMKDLFLFPSDPEFDALGSLEITGAFIDECNQVVVKARNVVSSRIRYKLDDFTCFGEPTKDLQIVEEDEKGRPLKWIDSKGRIVGGLIPKLLMTCNPAKNWVYADFYKPSRDNELRPYRKFIQALATDNKYISRHYITQLSKLDENSKERLLNGNWEYDDDPAKLMEFEAITDLFSNNFVQEGKKYISGDVARLGSDNFIIGLWDGLRLVKVKKFKKTRLDDAKKFIDNLRKEHRVPRSKIVVDEDGVGGGLVDFMRGVVGFVNNSKALKGENYANLKAQCYYKLAEVVNEREIWIQTK